MKTQELIESTCDSIKSMLLEKNRKYGDSAVNPVRIFSKSDPVEQILVRIDDKLSRISKGVGLVATDEDVVNDLIGYLILLKVAKIQKLDNKWDGSDIEPSLSYGNANTDFVCFGNNSDSMFSFDFSSKEDDFIQKMYAAGDRFA